MTVWYQLGQMAFNPVLVVKAPCKRTADDEIIEWLTAGELKCLFEDTPMTISLKNCATEGVKFVV